MQIALSGSNAGERAPIIGGILLGRRLIEESLGSRAITVVKRFQEGAIDGERVG